MKKTFIKVLDSFKRVLSKNIDNDILVTTIDELVAEDITLKGIVAEIAAVQSIATDPTAITGLTVETAKSNLCGSITNCLYRVGVKAEQDADTAIITELNRPATYFSDSTKDELLTKADKTIKLIDKNKGILTNLKPTDLPKMKAAYTGLLTIKDQPRKNIIDKKALVTEPTKLLIKAGKASMKRTIKLVKGNDDVFSKELRDEYILSAKQVKPIVVPTPMNIIVEDATTGKGIKDVKALRTSSKAKKQIVFVSDVSGLIAFKTHKAGKVVYVFTLAGYVTLTVEFDVKSKVENDFVVKLVKV